jgi:hypothetical protein
LVADLYVVGGAAITLAYDERRATKDIDAVFVPKKEVYAAAARVAAALDLPDGWLNDAVKGFLLGPDRFPTKTIEMPGLRCEVASAETVLVLKQSPARTDSDDSACLVPARFTGGPEPLHVAVRASWVGGTAEGAHQAVERRVAVSPVDGMPLPGKREPHEGLRFRVWSGHNSEHKCHPLGCWAR